MAASSSAQRMSLSTLVVGSMIGAGFFSLPRTFANATGPSGSIFGWCFAGAGMYALARVHQALADRGDDPGAPSAFLTALSHAAWYRKTNQ